MTTIAYKDGVIACDSRTTAGYTIDSDNANKRQEKDGFNFFMCGDVSDIERFIEGFPDDISCNLNTGGIMVTPEKEIFKFGTNESGMWKTKLKYHWACGSGEHHALTAMDMGCDAVGAVKMAAKRDVCTGGRIRKYVVNG